MARRRRGSALAITLGALVLVGAVLLGVLFVALQDERASAQEVLAARALAATESGLALTIAPGQWDSAWTVDPRRGLLATRAFVPADGALDTVRVAKLDARAFLLDSHALAGSAAGASRVQRRLTLLITVDDSGRARPTRAHAWTFIP